MEEDKYYMCNSSYIPTSAEYFTSLGSFSTSILIIGGLITLGLFVLFFEQIVYTNQTAHHGAKRNIYWIASVFPMMTLMSLVALVIPRASDVCLSVKMVYMSIGISHFTDLTMVMFGGEQLLVERGCDDTFSLNLSPLCCCCRCLPRPPVTKYSLRLVALMTDQLPFAQAMYYITVMILLSADNITLGDVKPSGAFLWLNLFKIASALFGVYGFMILSRFSKGYLDDFEYYKKSRSIRLLLLITSFQSMIFNIMANYGVFPCMPPYVTSTVYKQTVDNSLYLLEMMVLGPYTYWQYHDQKFSTPITGLPSYRATNRSISITNSRKNSISGTLNTTITATADTSDFTDDDENSSGGRNSINSNNSRRHNATYAVDMDYSREVPATSHTSNINSRHSTNRRSRSRNSDSSERSSAFGNKDSMKDRASSRNKERNSSTSNIRQHSSGNSSASGGNSVASNMENSASDIKDKTSKSNRKETTRATSQSTNMDNGASTSQNSTRERSNSPSNTYSIPSTSQRSVSPSDTSNSTSNGSPPHSTTAAAPNLLNRALRLTPHISKGTADYVRF